MSARLIITAALLLAACGTDDVIDFELDVDPNISTAGELADRLGTILVILDSDEGLYPPGAETSAGDLQVKNADADPALEVVQTVTVSDGTLPTIRLERGGLSVGAVDVRVLGLDRDTSTAIAEGSARGIAFGTGEPVSVPFNFLVQERPPRVIEVFPRDGMAIPGCELPSLTVVFSRPMDAASVEGAIAVGSLPVSDLTLALNASNLVADVTFAVPLQGNEEELVVELEVGTDARADDGTSLDQSGGQEGAQPYRATLQITCSPPPTAPCDVACPWACGAKECPNLPQIACVDGVCMPVACSASCDGDTVCDPLGDECVADCREADALTTCAVGACSETTGLCE